MRVGRLPGLEEALGAPSFPSRGPRTYSQPGACDAGAVLATQAAALGHAVSGSAGTAAATAAVFLLTLATTRLRAARATGGGAGAGGDEGGVAALYRGLAPDVARSAADSFLFSLYGYLRGRRVVGALVVGALAAAALAGACARAVTTPLATVVARMQVAEGPTSRRAAADACRRAGLARLWSSYSATLFLTLNPAITFSVHCRLARRVLPAFEGFDLPVAWAAFLLLALSKATATALTYPFHTGKLRLQTAGESARHDPPASAAGRGGSPLGLLRRLFDRSVLGVIASIIFDQGAQALYGGLGGEILRSFPDHGLAMLFKGLFFRLAVRLWLLFRPRLRKWLQTQ